MKSLPLIMLGAGGHASVLFEIIRLNKMQTLGAVIGDDQLANKQLNIPILGKDDIVQTYSKNAVLLVNALGGKPGSHARCSLFEYFSALGYQFATLIHPSAIIAESVQLGQGVQVMAGTVLQPGVIVGENGIINTRVSIDHGSIIGKHVHIAPGAVVCGDVIIEENVYIGAGAAIANSIKIGKNAMIGCGVSIVRDIPENMKVIPAAIRQIGV